MTTINTPAKVIVVNQPIWDTGMARMMQDMHGSGYTGNPDKDFLSMMITHYEGAIDMARLVLIHGRDPLVRQIAETSLPARR